jgi:beta-aspartyl-dipeptidase (metallo-type)
VANITGSVRDDIILIPDFIGVGEVAISDHRSSVPTAHELARIASEARVAGMLSGKKGIVSLHVGDSTDYLDILDEVLEISDIPVTQFYPTHINRNLGLLNAGKYWARGGGYIDLTTSTTEMDLARGEPACSKALSDLLQDEVPVSQITFSSDGHASLPVFDEDGELAGLMVGREDSLYREVQKAIQEFNIDVATAIQVITSSPAKVLGLKRKGHISTEHDADCVVLNKDSLAIETVIAKGQVVVQNGECLIRGTFE